MFMKSVMISVCEFRDIINVSRQDHDSMLAAFGQMGVSGSRQYLCVMGVGAQTSGTCPSCGLRLQFFVDSPSHVESF